MTHETVKALSSLWDSYQSTCWEQRAEVYWGWLLKGFGMPIITSSSLPPGTGNYTFPQKTLQVDSSCLSQGVICEELVGGTAPSLCLYHCVVGLERAVEVCLAIGQIEGLWPTAQHCPFHGTCGTGTIQTLVDPRDVSRGREPLLQPGRVLDPTRSLTSAGDHTNRCGNPKAWQWAGRLPRRGKSWCLLLTPTAPCILGAGRTKVSQIAEGGK